MTTNHATHTIHGSFQYRVNFAANYMARGIVSSRALDNCFEMFDGALVVTALVRRAMKNPKLWDSISKQWGGTFPQTWIDTASKYNHLKTRQLPLAAAAERERAQSAWDARNAPQ
jgi:hypothetical protein